MNRFLSLTLSTLFLFSCQTQKNSPKAFLIRGVPGPEDLVWDSSEKRILISSDPRRTPTKNGNIYALNPITKKISLLPREKDPFKEFHPHGLSLVKMKNGETRLYVVTHQYLNQKIPHSIRIYRVLPEKLLFLQSCQNALLTSPNDVCALADGSFYVANDRSEKGGFFELLLGLKKSTLVYCNTQNNWKIAARGFAMANSIQITNSTAYVSETRGNRIVRFEIATNHSLIHPQTLAKIPGPDNLEFYRQFLIVSSHKNLLAFMRHASNPKVKSPSSVYLINTRNGNKKEIFRDSGKEISAASVGLILNKKVWIGQVFDDFVYVYPLEESFQ